MPSDKDRLRQVSDHIDRIKAADYPAVVGSEKGYRIVERPWMDMPEPSKLAILQDSVDWSGVSNRDQAHILLGQVDPGKLTDPQRNRLIDAATRDEPAAEEKPLSPAQMKTLMKEMREEEHAARVSAYGEADAATYDARMAEAYRLRGEEYGPPVPPSPPLTEAELQEVERGWSQPSGQTASQPDFADILRAARSTPLDTRSDFQRMLDDVGNGMKAQPKERDRGGPER